MAGLLALLIAAYMLPSNNAHGIPEHPGSYAPSSAYDSKNNRFLLAFTDVDDYMVPAIYGIFVNHDASPLGTPFLISGNDYIVPLDAVPSVAADPQSGKFLVTWQAGSPEQEGAWEIIAQPLDTEGKRIGDNTILGEGELPVTAFSNSAGNFIVAWQGPGKNDEQDIYARLLEASADMSLINSDAMLVYNAPGPQASVSVASGYDEAAGMDVYMLVFEDMRSGSPTISAQAIDAHDGTLLTGADTGLNVSGEPDEPGTAYINGGDTPSVAYTGDGTAPFLVVWRSEAGEVLMRYMDSPGGTGPPLDSVSEVKGREGYALNPKAATDTTSGRSIIMWQEINDGQYDLYASFIDTGLYGFEPYHTAPVAAEPGMDETAAGVSFNSRMPSFLVAYEYTDNLSVFNLLLTTVSDPDYPEITVDDPVYPYEDLVVEYPGVAFHTSISHTVNVYNDSPVSGLDITNVTSSGPFSVITDNCTMQSVPPSGPPCSLTVEFTPTTRGMASGILNITSNDPNEPATSLFLSGMGIAPEIEVTDSSLPANDGWLNLGTIRPGQMSEGAVTIRNIGEHFMMLGKVKGVTGGFGISSDGCSLQALMPGGFCIIEVYAMPEFDGMMTGGLWITSDDPERPLIWFSLSAEGGSPEFGASSGGTVEFGEFGSSASGETTSQVLRINNTGNMPMLINSLSVSGDAFAIEDEGCSGTTLEGGQECSVTVYFQPGGVESYTGAVIVSTDDARDPEKVIPLWGNGASAIASVHIDGTGGRQADFGDMETGEARVKAIRVTNLGQAALSAGVKSLDAPGFELVLDGCAGKILPYAGSCLIEVAFRPGVMGDMKGSLLISTNDPEERLVAISLSGTGVPPMGEALGSFFYGY